MRLTPRNIGSLVLGLGGAAMLAVGLFYLLNTGSCASGGPYVTARSCPAGTGRLTFLLIAGTVVWLAGLVLSEEGLVKPGTGQAVWTLGFTGIGVTVLAKALLQDSMPPDSRLGAVIVGAVFIPMGLAVGVGGLLQLRRERTRQRPRPTVPDTPERRLHRLRSTGALTRAEFVRLKHDPPADILALVQRLADQREAGELTDAEFETTKRQVLQGCRRPPREKGSHGGRPCATTRGHRRSVHCGRR
ncbi:SHOCT domain-containing protein [Dactylosporangium sp. AC04546]|uniref:SHOCT domain-containing protein n=1 Tax=Dactylosporangium sp. AC04546 TaxID=2862460 RepID=UPI001EDD12AD|nr:SHOCT domain-containing protein [Dactylosporangium sp. AC04546]WVK78450.1 SHOCT domain-containing protein [Dactylosporangium sp. AC04546]